MIADEHNGALSFGQLASGAAIRPQGVGRRLIAGETIRLGFELAQILDQRLEGTRIVDGDQAARAGIDGSLFARVIRSDAARRPVSRPPTLLTPSH